MVSKAKMTRPHVKEKLAFGNSRCHGVFTLNGGALTMVDINPFIIIWDE
jgi:hypothetical protein